MPTTRTKKTDTGAAPAEKAKKPLGRKSVPAVKARKAAPAKSAAKKRTLTVVHADARNLRLPGRPFRVVASPPYGITAELLGLLLAPGSRLVAADLVLQRAVARKHASRRARSFRLSMGPAVPRRAFRPPPQVDSAVLVVRRL